MFASTEASGSFHQLTEIVGFGKGFFTLMLYAALVAGVGCVIVHVMHKNHVHWRWSRLVVGLLAAVFVFGMGQFTLNGTSLLVLGGALAAFVAMRRGSRWQRSEEQTGGEKAEIARERVTPALWLRLLIAGHRQRAASGAEPRARGGHVMGALAAFCVSLILFSVSRPDVSTPDETLYLGCDMRGQDVYVSSGHVLIVGATRMGKTTTIRRLLWEQGRVQQELDDKLGIIAMDGKGDPDLRRTLEELARRLGVRFRCWSPRGEEHYDLFAHGGTTEQVDRVLGAEEFSDSYYLRIAQWYLALVIKALKAAGVRVTFKNIAKYMMPEDMKDLGPRMDRLQERDAWQEFEEVIADLKGRELEAISGLKRRLSVLAGLDDVGPLLEPGKDGDALNLLESLRNREIVYFDLHASANEETAKMLGALITSDLKTAIATLQYSEEQARTMLVLDDVQAWVSDAAVQSITSLYARSGSVGATIILGTQSFADLRTTRNQYSLEQITDNIGILIVHRVPGPRSRRMASEAFGDREETQTSRQVDGRDRPADKGTQRQERVPRVQPDALKDLEPGEAVMLEFGQEEPIGVLVAAVD